MNAGRVIGRMWATRKDASLEGRRLLVVQPLNFRGAETGPELVALDTVDAGVGDRVLYVTSSEATIPFRPGLTATDATIVGILERVDHVTGSW
ncbi:MAG: ethanolamine utilization protein EutN [Bacteroidetes bacterium CG12_big_fil_rev_8_21_14_0_65_60_17]|nr:MAG: ethanolamine utilization protein EutN [Bacteroidetes bacterium CG12_big_fil_rev_8_21_14_0_65_60_17]